MKNWTMPHLLQKIKPSVQNLIDFFIAATLSANPKFNFSITASVISFAALSSSNSFGLGTGIPNSKRYIAVLATTLAAYSKFLSIDLL